MICQNNNRTTGVAGIGIDRFLEREINWVINFCKKENICGSIRRIDDLIEGPYPLYILEFRFGERLTSYTITHRQVMIANTDTQVGCLAKDIIKKVIRILPKYQINSF